MLSSVLTERLYVRAFDCEKHGFADFVLTRVRSCSYSDMPRVGQAADAAWHNLTEIVMTADPGLEVNRRRIVEFEFGIRENGERLIHVRTALVLYALVQFDLLVQGQRKSRYHLVCRNNDELKARAQL
jgi:predicted DNA-binding transcriptional regulator YafY